MDPSSISLMQIHFDFSEADDFSKNSGKRRNCCCRAIFQLATMFQLLFIKVLWFIDIWKECYETLKLKKSDWREENQENRGKGSVLYSDIFILLPCQIVHSKMRLILRLCSRLLFENIVTKEDIDQNEQFLFLSLCFQLYLTIVHSFKGS